MSPRGSTGAAGSLQRPRDGKKTLARKAYPNPLQWDCANNRHSQRRPTVKQLSYVWTLWTKRGFVGVYPCCIDGARRMISDLIETGDLTKRPRARGARPT